MRVREIHRNSDNELIIGHTFRLIETIPVSTHLGEVILVELVGLRVAAKVSRF